jgi:hypothetical protein
METEATEAVGHTVKSRVNNPKCHQNSKVLLANKPSGSSEPVFAGPAGACYSSGPAEAQLKALL